ncbi:MAG: histidine phosphatase family protein [Lachnospiraceae bacterium]|nr:histidine phosphatase family protein [Lachnospiraceae bacterium]
MKAVVLRHAEVDFGWSRRCTSKGFDLDCSGYDSAPIRETAYNIPKIKYKRIYISELSRSRDTADKLFPDGKFIRSGLINEVPLGSSFDTEKKFPLWFWNLTGRLQWFINSTRQVEGRRQTIERARQFAALISEEDSDCAVVTHGFYMHTLLREMKNAGFRIDNSSVNYKNGAYVIAEKQQTEGGKNDQGDFG